jgi:ribosomal protein L35
MAKPVDISPNDKKTGSGKLRGRHSNQSHIREKMSPKRKKQLSRPAEIAPAEAGDEAAAAG